MVTITIPKFRDIVLIVTECLHCGNWNSEDQSSARVNPKGVRFELKVTSKEDRNKGITIEGILKTFEDDIQNILDEI